MIFADSLLPPLDTSKLAQPTGQNDYALVSNYEQVAYVSDDTPSMIHFQMARSQPTLNHPSESPLPELRLLLPEGIEVLGATRNLDVRAWGYQPTVEGTKFTNSWRVVPHGEAGQFSVTWRAEASQNWSEGDRLKGYYWGYSADGQQAYQPLAIEVVDVPETAPFETIPVWLSLPSDTIHDWPNTAASNTDAFSRIGINQMDLWSYLWDGEIGGHKAQSNQTAYGDEWLANAQQKLAASGIAAVPWAREVWWKNAVRQEANSRSQLADGTMAPIDGASAADYSLRLTYNDDNGGAGGQYFQAWIAQGKALVDRGFYLHSFNPEMYRNGELIGYDASTIAAFKTYYSTQTQAAYIDPQQFAQSPGKWADAERLWEKFKAERYVQFFRDYRAEMEAHMDSKEIDRPFKMKALTTYHRQWPGLYDEADYTESATYKRTLEDPKLLAEVFDYIAPMSYPDIYANGGEVDMKTTRKDTYAMKQLVEDSHRGTEVSPILSAGYPFLPGYNADTSAERLKANILEAMIAGAYGFGIWGVTPIDAKDMKAISESVGMLQPYEDILLSGEPTGGVSVEGDVAFSHRLQGDRGSLVLVSDYSDQAKRVTVSVESDGSNVIIDLDNPGVELSKVSHSNNTVRFNTALGKADGWVKLFYVGPRD